MNKKAKETIVGGILTAIVVIILLYVFFSVKTIIQDDNVSPELNKTLEDISNNVEEGVNWWLVGGGIVGALGLVSWAIKWAIDNDVFSSSEQGSL